MGDEDLAILCDVCGREIGDPRTDAEDFGCHGWESWVCMSCLDDYAEQLNDRHPGDFVEEEYT